MPLGKPLDKCTNQGLELGLSGENPEDQISNMLKTEKPADRSYNEFSYMYFPNMPFQSL